MQRSLELFYKKLNKNRDFIKCKDNSIIFCESDGNIILRFDENFDCNSDLIGKKIFIIKQSEYEKIENNYGGKYKLVGTGYENCQTFVK